MGGYTHAKTHALGRPLCTCGAEASAGTSGANNCGCSCFEANTAEDGDRTCYPTSTPP